MAVVTRGQSMLFQVILTFVLFLSILNNVNAGITSTFIRSEWPATDIPLDNEAFAVPNGHNAPQQVHITQGDYDGRSVIISWVSPDEPGSSKVHYGKSENNYEFTAEGTVNNYTFYKYKSGYIHHCLVDNLEYSTKYYYKIGSGDTAREFWFETPPEINSDTPYKFGIIGDLGQTYNSLSTLEHYIQSGAKAVLFLGDLSYADRYDHNDIGLRWDTWGRFVERSTAYQPWIWNAGNHEIDYFPHLEEVTPFKNYLERYTTPYKACKSSSPLWYAIRRASAHIIVLSSYSPFGMQLPVPFPTSSLFILIPNWSNTQIKCFSPLILTVKYTPQWTWLREELKRVDREKTPWLIVLMHVPIYNSNSAHFMEGESMRSVFESWFVEYKVDVIFAGHVHAYERSYRISNIRYNITSGDAYPVPDKSAPVYITVGDGGNQEGLADRFLDPQPEYSAFREASYGHSTLEIMNRTHALYHWNRNDDGKKLATDAFVLRNQYWANNQRRRKLKKHYLRSVVGGTAI
ncbi:bifunctional purple acid phosphatase 26 isoform X1 [Cannabis sativa]|uniref:bifunctional purple acid phosphatase 26 isoform X1 n=1 Tax=Cannabis sativa TaxID=3483 RepID=UPI0011DF1115|nr:bifunctional purple acid phosphatase 26 isoform X1 [Cannabis sativa]XP_030510565.1 bifunctional purple acid phosphatase 26 isoform X1 [Cannabis sativa]XP_060973065.1 bifunctional purple acid phosphatase 26 isoform X1 [Cannabis sativa]XP_060973066.1 bifunctional purple acid phosphatase 26 isoform X1 [Cannabis sativa]